MANDSSLEVPIGLKSPCGGEFTSPYRQAAG
jgi:hypothetical protein